MSAWQREEIQIEARRWVGTPYVHQHRIRGEGVDCIGLIWGVGEAVGVLQVSTTQAKPFLGYSRTPNPNRMGKALETFFRPTQDPQPGDFGWLAWDREHAIPMHLAILAERRGQLMLIHADSQQGRCVEHGFTMEWPGLVKSWWAYPGVDR